MHFWFPVGDSLMNPSAFQQSMYITSWQIHGETVETVRDFIFLGSKITADGDVSHEIKTRLFLGRKAMISLDSILKVETLLYSEPTKVCIFKSMVFLVITCGFKNWTIKKAEHWRISALYFIFFNLILFFKLYIIVLVLPNIKMNLAQVYMCSPSWTLLPPPSPFHPSGSSQCTSPKHPVSCIEPGLVTCFIHDILHVSMPFSRIFPPSPSLSESIRLFYTSVSLLLSRTQGYCYHLSKFHIYVLVSCIGVFLSGLLHSV